MPKKRLRDLPNCEDCPKYLREAIASAFSNEELDELYLGFNVSHGFLGIGFTGPGSKFCKHADPTKAYVIMLMESNLWRWVPEPGLLAPNMS